MTARKSVGAPWLLIFNWGRGESNSLERVRGVQDVLEQEMFEYIIRVKGWVDLAQGSVPADCTAIGTKAYHSIMTLRF